MWNTGFYQPAIRQTSAKDPFGFAEGESAVAWKQSQVGGAGVSAKSDARPRRSRFLREAP
ncbi:MAG: hypothetical protein V2G44_01680 [bacterium JZ-2024 1]